MRTSPFPYNKGNTRIFFITFCMTVCLCYLYSVFYLTEATKFTVDPKNVVQERNKNQKRIRSTWKGINSFIQKNDARPRQTHKHYQIRGVLNGELLESYTNKLCT